MRRISTFGLAIYVALLAAVLVSGCGDDKADVASENISKAADNFEVFRTTRFINTITDSEYLSVEGFCNLEDEGNQLEVTCRIGPDEFVKDFYGLCDQCTYVAEQKSEDAIDVSEYHYRVTFAPQRLIPDFDAQGSTEDTPFKGQ